MKKVVIVSIFVFSLIVIGFVSCKKQNQIPIEDTHLDQPNLPATAYGYLSKHGIDSNLATLGRVLFYDRNLSINNSISCGSCHKQEFAFANNVRFDRGFNGLPLTRNSPSIQGFRGFMTATSFNSFNGTPTPENQLPVLMFWDGRQKNMADMVLNPVTNHNEMNMPGFDELITKLQTISYYPDLFKKAYGDETITKDKIAFAMEAFVSCLNTTVPKESKIDTLIFFTNPNFGMPVTIKDMVDMGKFLFHNKYNCAKCHDQDSGGGGGGQYNNPTDPTQLFNIGLDEVYQDQGLGRLTGKQGDNGLFKVPTLKNISLTAPYMHDGRYANLNDVLDHYSHNIKGNANLSPLFKNTDGSPKKLNILPIEKQALLAFLNTLKDEDFLTSPMYSDPFKK